MENQKTPFTFTEWGITQDCVHPVYSKIKFKDGLYLFKDIVFTEEMGICKPGEKYAYALLNPDSQEISFYTEEDLDASKVIKVWDVKIKRVTDESDGWSDLPIAGML